MGHKGIRKVGLAVLLLGGQLVMACGKNPGYATGWVPVPPADTAAQTQPGDTAARPKTSDSTYLALGDSYTIGQSVGIQDRYPNQAAALLATMGDTIAAPEIIATTGWTTGDLLNDLAGYPPKRPGYGHVTLLIGVNNQYQGRSLSEYQTQFAALLQKSIHWAGDNPKHVIVLSIPDYGDSFYGQSQPDPAAISAAIDTFNAANLQISTQYGVQYLDITGYTRQAKGDSSLFAPDGLHYSGKEMALWARALVKLW
ncbi:SGNH/GDSL hydrolase family protein [Dinghuibacter silviterrae]|uniref:Lysophospholipase L1-like esterase n=1 Tax=Dinghuibacter silviterrae TaxID=1539049 RepID=A0A4R8DFC3_9BACT|nr:GDSL-type esterase/lipase family protein [Dinghuibacter silviterrae]TDW96281.1 lysophospholipase L1-like esterase [Dinghuibacter silviterrae]